MNIAEISTRNIPAIALTATLQEAGIAMRTASTGILPVVENGRLVGTLSERDLAIYGYGAGLDPRDITVSRIYDHNPVACVGDVHLKSALELMRERQQTWLIVLDRQGSVTGVVSLIELLDLLVNLMPKEETDGPEMGPCGGCVGAIAADWVNNRRSETGPRKGSSVFGDTMDIPLSLLVHLWLMNYQSYV